ncbi:MAG: hypothetical protein ACK56F_04520, partial [bacterium]
MAKAAELMKFYKLELQNRESNFNKMFNANPNVGVLNPFDQKVIDLLFRKIIYSLLLKNLLNNKINSKIN